MSPIDRPRGAASARGGPRQGGAEAPPYLPFDDASALAPPDPVVARDEAARAFAVDPSRNVVLEASAGTGKTRVLVTRYINLLRAGVDPANVLAITFTRKAAAEMRERIVLQLRDLASRSPADALRWRELRGRLGDIEISTIDAFCLALLREFPLEADLDPGFAIADETETPQLVDEALDSALRAARRMSAADADVALVLARLGERKLKAGLTALLGRRLVAGSALRRFLAAGAGPDGQGAFAAAMAALQALLCGGEGGVDAFLADGPLDHPAFGLFTSDVRAVAAGSAASRAVLDRLASYFITTTGKPRSRPAPGFRKEQCVSPAAWKRHSQAVASMAPYVADMLASFERDINRAMARGVERLFHVARGRYRRAMESKATVDFTEGLWRALGLLRRMDEFAQSRYRLEARYHHVLVDEFQDTSRAQWKLVARLIESWGEGSGLSHDAPLQPSIFIVGDRKQSIYGFRDADVRLLGRARRHIGALRPGGRVRRSIARSFRSAPELLAFTNDLFGAMEVANRQRDAFRYRDTDRFPLGAAEAAPTDALGLVPAASATAAAQIIAGEIARLLAGAVVRDRQTGAPRPAEPGDVAILFRSRESHREFESALDTRGIPTYVYKGLGFFDADEVKDLVALVRYLSDPASDLRAAALLRSRRVRLSDGALRRLSPRVARALLEDGDTWLSALPAEDARVLRRLRASLRRWLALADRVPPAELLDVVLTESAYAFELQGPRLVQARENLKKVRAVTRRLQNRGYATIARVADHLDRLSAGDESNAIIDAAGAVNLMTVHASKGLEFPIVFLVNLGRGTGGGGDPILLVQDPATAAPIVSVGGASREADEAARARDREETKRLLYVAVTRARERLYLSAVLREGRLVAGRGSLAEVLPAGVRDLFAAAAVSSAVHVEWTGHQAEPHRLRVCRLEAAAAVGGPEADPAAAVRTSGGCPGDAVRDDFAPLGAGVAMRRVGVTAFVEHADLQAPGRPGRVADAGQEDAVLIGTLVHRLFEACAQTPLADEAALASLARQLLAPEEVAAAADRETLVTDACRCYLSLAERADLKSLLASAACLYEVPFSMGVPAGDTTTMPAGETPCAERAHPVVVRGSIDCLAILPDGRVIVVEIKTGRRHGWHQAQLELYMGAVRELMPGAPVEGLLVYAEAEPAGPAP